MILSKKFFVSEIEFRLFGFKIYLQNTINYSSAYTGVYAGFSLLHW